MTLIKSSEVKILYFMTVCIYIAKARMKYTVFSLHKMKLMIYMYALQKLELSFYYIHFVCLHEIEW